MHADIAGEYERVNGLENTPKIMDKLNECIAKTSVSLKDLVQENYHDFIDCFVQTRGIDLFFSANNSGMTQNLQRLGIILRYQDELHFDMDWRCKLEMERVDELAAMGHIPGNDMVDSPSQLMDDIHAMMDEGKWLEAVNILNMMSEDLYRGEYKYLKPKTRKQLKRKLVRARKAIYRQLSKLLTMNAYNKTYRRRLSVYILMIDNRTHRYLHRGIKLYFECKAKELDHNIEHLPMRGEAKIFVADLTFLVFNAIRELIQEFNQILVESANVRHKDAYSYLTVFILKTVLMRYVDDFKKRVFEATKGGISLQLIGECLKVSFGYFNKLKWNGLYLEMYIKDHLFDIIVDSLKLYFEDLRTETSFGLLHETLAIKEVSLLAVAPRKTATIKSMHHDLDGARSSSLSPQTRRKSLHPNMKMLSPRTKRRTSLNKYESVAIDISRYLNKDENRMYAQSHSKEKMLIFITQSTQTMYDNIARCLYESRTLLSFSYYPVMATNLLNVFIDQITKYLQSYCSNITLILRRSIKSLSLKQDLSIICNVYYITNDLLERINARLLKQCRFRRIERIEAFKQKLVILYKEQFKYLAKTVAMRWIKERLFVRADRDQNELSFPIVSPSKAWMELNEQILKMRRLCIQYLHQNIANTMTQHIARSVLKHLNDHKYWKHHRLHQLIFDLKFFEFTVCDYLDDESKVILNDSIISNAIAAYNESNHPQIALETDQWFQSKIQQFLMLHPHLNLNVNVNANNDDNQSHDDHHQDDELKVSFG